MSILHFCNTFFESELEGKVAATLEKTCRQNPIFFQLQFLPCLYANQEEGILVTDLPKEPRDFAYYLTQDRAFSFHRLETWGYSKLVKQWAENRGIDYPMPPWEVVKQVNSKSYSFAKSPLPGARLLLNGDKVENRMVLKSCFGTAGRGMVFSDSAKAKKFCEEQWKAGHPVLAEPWVNRVLDFSTQWFLSPEKNITFLGTTLCKTTSTGVHQSNTAGMQPPSFVEEQKSIARSVLEEMADFGYFGEVGFDAMIYDKNKLQPIVEINARKTMGYVTLMYQKKKHPDQIVELAYIPSKERGPLPLELGDMKFSRQVIMSIHE